MKKGLRITIWVAVFSGAVSIVAFTLISNKEKANDDINKELLAVPFTVRAAYVNEETFADDATFRGNVEAKNVSRFAWRKEGLIYNSQAFRLCLMKSNKRL